MRYLVGDIGYAIGLPPGEGCRSIAYWLRLVLCARDALAGCAAPLSLAKRLDPCLSALEWVVMLGLIVMSKGIRSCSGSWQGLFSFESL